MSTLATLLECPDLTDKHRKKLEKMVGLTLSPAMEFSLTRIAQKYKNKTEVKKTKEDQVQKLKCSYFHHVSFSDLLEVANSDEQKIISAVFEDFKQQHQKKINALSLADMNIHRVSSNNCDYEQIFPIISKYYEEESFEKEPPTVEDWREFVAEIIEMQLTFFNEIPKPEEPVRFNKFEQLLWEYNLAMNEDEEDDRQSPVTNHQSSNTTNKRNAKIDWTND